MEEKVSSLPPSFDEDGNMNPAFTKVELFDWKDAKTLTNPDCKHEWVKDPTDEEPGFYAEMCKHCPLGRLVRK